MTMARSQSPAETLHVVLDDATVERLRQTADALGIEVEQLIVYVVHRASWAPTDSIGRPGTDDDAHIWADAQKK